MSILGFDGHGQVAVTTLAWSARLGRFSRGVFLAKARQDRQTGDIFLSIQRNGCQGIIILVIDSQRLDERPLFHTLRAHACKT